jgi:hypothetical protein
MEMKVKFAGLESLMEEDLANDMMMLNQGVPSSPVSVFKGEIHHPPEVQNGKKKEKGEKRAMEVVKEKESVREEERKVIPPPPIAIISADDEMKDQPSTVLPQHHQKHLPAAKLPVLVEKVQPPSHAAQPTSVPQPDAVAAVVKDKELLNKLNAMDIVDEKKEKEKDIEVPNSQAITNSQYSQPLATMMDQETKVICSEVKRYL